MDKKAGTCTACSTNCEKCFDSLICKRCTSGYYI